MTAGTVSATTAGTVGATTAGKVGGDDGEGDGGSDGRGDDGGNILLPAAQPSNWRNSVKNITNEHYYHDT